MVENDIMQELSQKYNPRFGQISVEKGFASSEQVKQAVLEQIDDNLAKKPHRFIGRIMLDRGWLNAQQVDEILNELFRNEIHNELYRDEKAK